MTIPTPARHIPQRRKWRPEPKPEGGYRVEPATETASHLAGLDHVAEIRTALERLTEADQLMDTLERRMTKLYARLADPALLAQYPADHPLRIEGEDRLQAIDQAWNVAHSNATEWACLIHAHGQYLIRDGNGAELDALGRELTHGWGPLGRVQRSIDGLTTGATWQRLAAAACPF